MTNKGGIIYLLGTLIILLCIILQKCHKGKDDKPNRPIQYWEKPGFKTKVINTSSTYTKHDTFIHSVPPIEILNWYQSPTDNKLIISNDSLLRVVDSLNNQLSVISKLYLTQFPTASKLISGSFKLDTLKLDLLNIEGNISTFTYPTDYSHFEYQFSNNKMTARDVLIKTPNKLSHNVYINGGYNVVAKVPLISADYFIRYRWLQLGVESMLTLEKIPTLGIIGKAGIRIK